MPFVQPWIFFFVLTVFSWSGVASVQCRDVFQLESLQSSEVLDELFGIGRFDAKQLFKEGKFQEAAWIASQKYGDRHVRAQIEELIAADMKEGQPAADPVRIEGGSTVAELVGMESGHLVVFKPAVKYWEPVQRARAGRNYNAKHEVAGYRLSKLLEWDVVGVTVEGQVSGREGSLQSFVHRDSSVMSPESIHRLEIFDHLIDNRDRVVASYKNALSFKGRAIGYDHGLAFQPSNEFVVGTFRPVSLKNLQLDPSTKDIYVDLKTKI